MRGCSNCLGKFLDKTLIFVIPTEMEGSLDDIMPYGTILRANEPHSIKSFQRIFLEAIYNPRNPIIRRNRLINYRLLCFITFQGILNSIDGNQSYERQSLHRHCKSPFKQAIYMGRNYSGRRVSI